jgi:hypothetical protein
LFPFQIFFPTQKSGRQHGLFFFLFFSPPPKRGAGTSAPVKENPGPGPYGRGSDSLKLDFWYFCRSSSAAPGKTG